jgi:hypothetical protein
LASCTALKKLELRLTNVTDQGVAELKKSLPDLQVTFDQ